MTQLDPQSTILALETSCDETAAAVIHGGRWIVSNAVASQMHLHERYGGVVPELASRQHITTLVPVIEEALAPLPRGWDAIDAIACTYGPGLPGALLAGVNAAKGLAWARGKALIAVNHLEAHIYANWLYPEVLGARAFATERPELPPPEFPLVCLIVSGGHTALVLLRDHGDYTLLGQTRDDAAGEAFDKAARLMGLGYPGGPHMERLAAGVDPGDVVVPRAWLGESFDFSFSGIKTFVLHATQRALRTGETSLLEADPQYARQLAAAFQEAVVDVLVTKTLAAAERFAARSVLLAGGVAANRRLRQVLSERSPVPVRYPPLWLCTDNAAMVGAAAYYRAAQGLQHGWELSVKPNLRLV
ncbi:tRNA (adenosine(37)-N6)-threonylcarbamoyltransferase complex transferase subunit TsaD [Kallotenue papyrolyticum]|uniref:tRNA (adenosine(37)-N6)-threonylcarbamoyltransferase complex transferase subunit TsaD n=1 Tax=Kallotenue papyrolyticum TaxID=1325125 RepID=UPI0004786725|nr:tRNA (adenosine(37)-N6)-threonylcarbamoyltransferase complex transferase subunit TsaD [Kallotenue papyrolyticum]